MQLTVLESSNERLPTTLSRAATLSQRSTGELIDGIGRRIDHLRISITDRCDLKCVYCRPDGDVSVARTSRDLSLRQRVVLVETLAKLYGLSEVRITGGEPLVEKSAIEFVSALRRALPNIALKMTTNGRRLRKFAVALRTAGLDRLNVSLDSIFSETYRHLTGGDVQEVVAGIAAARAAGFAAPKINVVTLRGINDKETGAMVEWALREGLELRFLEPMPIGPVGAANKAQFISAAEIRESLDKIFELHPLPRTLGATARLFRVSGTHGSGVIGFIAPISEPFCSDCRRMRITADGHMYPCLLDSRHVDLRPAWRDNAWDEAALDERIASMIAKKLAAGPGLQNTPMISLGG